MIRTVTLETEPDQDRRSVVALPSNDYFENMCGLCYKKSEVEQGDFRCDDCTVELCDHCETNNTKKQSSKIVCVRCIYLSARQKKVDQVEEDEEEEDKVEEDVYSLNDDGNTKFCRICHDYPDGSFQCPVCRYHLCDYCKPSNTTDMGHDLVICRHCLVRYERED
mmetsp:Transcript_1526/g.1700  ORF Transcript_1526/g.1700 Transcript_1526/m.1700 type:complete len:165 (-) Transcript_1526:156-650(-)